LAIYCLLFISLKSFAQNGLGAILLSDSAYAALPTPNWDTLAKYAPNANYNSNITTFGVASGIVMLNTPPVGNQLTQGSCVGWAVGYSDFSILTYTRHYCWANANRSPSHIYNQIKVNASCASGSYVKDALNLVKNQGDCSLALLPYNDAECTTQPNAIQIADAGQNKAVNWVRLTNKNDVNEIKRALNLGYPVINAFSVLASFDNMWASGGIWSTNTGTYRGDHATCIVGYDDTRQMFRVQNQWGAFGGDNGFYWVT
jgi:C1A family cysteine protease